MNKEIIIKRIKSISVQIWILAAIISVGIFLRAYNHYDWLRFNADQGRDAEVVSGFLAGDEPLPLLGPKAGGTKFKLGPIFYYFQIASAKVFGDTPDKMAYPDLLAGILSIPLLYLFLRKYFDQKISLAMSAIFAVSEYAVSYARFAWNPNSTPFWTLLVLYAIHEVISHKKNRKFLWAIIAGIAIGVGVQLHTTLLILLPITTIIVFGYLAVKNLKILKYFFMILAVSLMLNFPQFAHEYKTGGDNVKAFFAGMKIKQAEKKSVIDKLLQDSSCLVQGNIAIISGYEISDTCSFKPSKHKGDLTIFVFGALFVLGGLLLAARNLLREAAYDRKVFLGLVYLFAALAYVLFFNIAFELSLRFYLALIFLPFLFLGFWLQFLKEKFVKHYVLIFSIAVILLVCSNLFYVHASFLKLSNYAKKGGTVDVIILPEAEVFADFIAANSDGKTKAYIDGNKKFIFKAYKPIRYLVSRSGIDLKKLKKNDKKPEKYFYVARSSKKEEILNDPNIEVFQRKTYGKFTILLIGQR